jgi:hypothetical protein
VKTDVDAVQACNVSGRWSTGDIPRRELLLQFQRHTRAKAEVAKLPACSMRRQRGYNWPRSVRRKSRCELPRDIEPNDHQGACGHSLAKGHQGPLHPALLATATATATAVHCVPISGPRLQVQVNRMVDLGYENPQLALTSLKALEIRSAQVVGSRRIIEAGIGLVAADSNLSDEARNAIAELDHRVPAARAIAQADSLLVRADMEAEAGEDQIQRSISDIMAAVSAYVGYMKETLSADRIVALLEMGRLQDGQRALPALLDALDAKAGLAERSTYVHELGEALFGAGELDSALALFNREHQAILVDRIVRSITMVPVSFQQRTIHVCASIGYATFPFDETQRSMSFDESLAIADAGMYYAKRHGRSVAVRIGKLPIDLLADLGGLPAAVEREALTGTVSLIIKRVAGKEADSEVESFSPRAQSWHRTG